MSRTLYSSLGWAAEKQTITAGGGLTGPVLVSAVSTDPNTVRLTFDRRLMLEHRQNGVYHAETLDLSSYQIVRIANGAPLEVVRTIWVDNTTIDLATANQQAFAYRVTCVAGGVMDFQGNVITEQTADFTGQQRTTYSTPSNIRLFTAGSPGMQEDLAGDDFYPDLEAPFLQNESPAPSELDVDPSGLIYLEIRDIGYGVDLTTVMIWVAGSLAYRGDTNTFLSPFDGPMSSVVHVGDTYQVTLERTSDFADYLTVSVRVYADDLSPIINTLDTTYTFRTWDHAAPVVDAHAPTGVGVSKSTLITLSVADAGIGVDLSTLNVTVSGVPAVVNGVIVAPFDGLSSAIVVDGLGYDVTLQKISNYASYETVSVVVTAKDFLLNSMLYNWSFGVEDYSGPLVHPVSPTNGQNNVPQDTDIVVEVTDEAPLVANSVRVRINVGTGWVIAYQQGSTPAFKPGYDGPGSGVVAISGGYRITIDPVVDFAVSTIVSVEVSADDPDGNPERLG